MNSSIVRYRWVDIAKGFAILSVVLLHINYQFYDSKCLPLATLLGELWHVPVFFLLGGFFLKEERLLQPVSFIKGKIKSLYRLLLYFYIPAVLLHNVLLHLGFYSQSVSYGGKLVTVYSVGKTLKELLLAVCLAGREPILGAMWFVYVLFMALCGLSIISWIVNRIIKRNENKEWVRCFVLLCLCIISCALTNLFDFTIPRFNNTITAMWLIYCGYILKNRLKLQFCNKYVCVISLFAAYHIAIISGGVSLNSNKYNDVLTLTISSVMVLYVICYFSKKIENSHIGHLLSKCGKDSFYIMGLHFLGFKIGSCILLLFGVSTDLASLTAPAGESLLLLIYYWIFAVAFSLAFMTLFRKVKNVFICRKSNN